MRLFFCPTCRRVYFLDEGESYLCGRNHAPSPSSDGRLRRFNISEKSEVNRPPWAVPQVVEERELLTQDLTEAWIDRCPYPEDEGYGDVRRHFGYGAPGGRHLTKEQVLAKYSEFVLLPVDS